MLTKATNQKVTECSEPAILDFINRNLLSQFDPPLQLTKLLKTDPVYKSLKSLLSGSSTSKRDGSTQMVKSSENETMDLLSKIDNIFDLYADFMELNKKLRDYKVI